MLNAVHLQTLDVVLSEGSLSAAARQLGYTKSAVSQHVAALERSLGVALFERGPHSLWPTAAGVAMGKHARSVLAALADAERQMRDYAAGSRGSLRIGAFPSVSTRVLPTALALLVDEFPHLELSLEQGDPVTTVGLLADCRIDLGLVYEYDHVSVSWPPLLVGHEILGEEMVVLCTVDRAQEPQVDGLAALHDATWVTSRTGTPDHDNFLGLCARAGFEPRVRFQTDDVEVVRGIVRCGLGTALVPALALGDDRSIGMRRMPDPPRRRVVALSRQDDPNPVIAAAVAAVSAAAGQFVEWSATALRNPAGTALAVAHAR